MTKYPVLLQIHHGRVSHLLPVLAGLFSPFQAYMLHDRELTICLGIRTQKGKASGERDNS